MGEGTGVLKRDEGESREVALAFKGEIWQMGSDFLLMGWGKNLKSGWQRFGGHSERGLVGEVARVQGEGELMSGDGGGMLREVRSCGWRRRGMGEGGFWRK